MLAGASVRASSGRSANPFTSPSQMQQTEPQTQAGGGCMRCSTGLHPFHCSIVVHHRHQMECIHVQQRMHSVQGQINFRCPGKRSRPGHGSTLSTTLDGFGLRQISAAAADKALPASSTYYDMSFQVDQASIIRLHITNWRQDDCRCRFLQTVLSAVVTDVMGSR